MSIKNMTFCEPYFTVKALENEKEYKIGHKSIVINLSEKDNIMVKDKPVVYLKSTIVTNITVQNLTKALIVEDYEKNKDHAAMFADIKKRWPLIYDMTKQERHKGLELWRSVKERVFGNIDINLCFISGGVQTGPHKTHYVNFTEVHTQYLGFGKMQKFAENDTGTIYQEVILSPGFTHEPFYNEQIVYPWHQYESITDAIYMPIEILPE